MPNGLVNARKLTSLPAGSGGRAVGERTLARTNEAGRLASSPAGRGGAPLRTRLNHQTEAVSLAAHAPASRAVAAASSARVRRRRAYSRRCAATAGCWGRLSAPGVSRQRLGELLGRLRLVLRVAPHQRRGSTLPGPCLGRERTRSRRPKPGRRLNADDISQVHARQRRSQRRVDPVTGVRQHHPFRHALGARGADLVERDCGLVLKTTSSGTPALARRTGSAAQSSGRYNRIALVAAILAGVRTPANAQSTMKQW